MGDWTAGSACRPEAIWSLWGIPRYEGDMVIRGNMAQRSFRAALLLSASLFAYKAHATDGVWNGPGGEWTDGTNWSSTPLVPDGTATFSNNAAPAAVSILNA